MESSLNKTLPTRQAHCDQHGSFDSINFVGTRWSGCPTCSALEREAEQARLEDVARRERRERRLRVSGVDGRFEEATFDNFNAADAKQQAVLDFCKGYAATVQWKGGAGLWLIGPPGTGKTHLGSSMVRHVIEQRDAAAAILSGREIIRTLRATWGNRGHDGETEEAVINRLGSLPLLVIDEIGVNFGSDAEHVQLFDIIDLRYKHRRPTVLLSNLLVKELKPAIGDRAYDRLREGAQVLLCDWGSYRSNTPKRPGLEVVR